MRGSSSVGRAKDVVMMISVFWGMNGIERDYEVARRVERNLFKRRKTINADYSEMRVAA